ncbi:S9 family peptidase [Actinomycetes bacterium NPDC127524]
MNKKGITAEDLYQLKSVTDPQLSPDGSLIAYIQTSIDDETDKYLSNLFVYSLLSRKTVQWTFGNFRHSSPRWSPDGQSLAFLSNRTGKNQIYLMSTYGGEAKQLTDFTYGASTPIWSPDSALLLTGCGLKTGESLESVHDKENKDDRSEGLIYHSIKYKADGKGYLNEVFQQLVIVNVQTKEFKLLTEGNRDYHPSGWSPDGSKVVYHTDEAEDRDYRYISDVFIMEAATKEKENVTNGRGVFYGAKWSPDGRYLIMQGHEAEYKGATLAKIWLFQTEDHSFSCLTDGWDVEVGDMAIGDFQIGAADPGLMWTKDSAGFYFLISDHGNTGVYYGTIEGAMYPSILESQHVYGLSINPETHHAAVAISLPDQPGDLFTYNLSTGEKEQITFVNEPFLKDRFLSKAEPIVFQSADGLDIHGWMMKPVNFQEGQKYPLILEIHGGPHAMYANSYFHEFQSLVSEGYAVLFTNPRGSHGYGQEFVNAVRGDYGGMDYADLMAAVDHALSTYDFIDSKRLGVTGGSYGGFMTNWIVGHTDRFKAAVTQRCISNWLSFYGVSDIGYYFTEWEVGGDILDDPEKLWHHSPLKYAKHVTTPLLLLHGEKDFRCPIEQSEQFYVALKRQKKEAVLVSFPDQTHEVSRSGAPKMKLQHVQQIRDWFKKYL